LVIGEFKEIVFLLNNLGLGIVDSTNMAGEQLGFFIEQLASDAIETAVFLFINITIVSAPPPHLLRGHFMFGVSGPDKRIVR